MLRLFVIPLSLFLAACEDSLMGPEVMRLPIGEVTAEHNGFKVELLRYNLSWFPSDDSPRPALDNVFATFLFEITNRSDAPRSISLDHFLLRTLTDQLHEGPVWTVHPGGRMPRLEATTLLPGQTIEGWLTFSILRGLLADELLWMPQEDIAFAFQVPWFAGGRIEEAFVFGRLIDASGTALANTLITLTPVETVPGISGTITDVGDCTGTPYNAVEARTDELGWYRTTLTSNNADELCIDVHRTSETEPRAAGVVRPGRPTEIAETPQVRIDLVLQQ
ncbi:MAG: hypothetical protein ACREMD_02620 [Gemmatimonadota bacterium]